MSKISFNKLGLNKKDEIKTIELSEDVVIEVKQYLTIAQKGEIINHIINNSIDDNNYYNPCKIRFFTDVELILGYTNITFTEKQKEAIDKPFDIMYENGLVAQIINQIPITELEYISSSVSEVIHSKYEYQNSARGILDDMATNYKDLNFDLDELNRKIAAKENIDLVSLIGDKLG